MEQLSYDQDGNSGFIIQSETNDKIGVVWTDTEDEEEINALKHKVNAAMAVLGTKIK